MARARKRLFRLVPALALAAVALPHAAGAEEGGLSIELNGLQPAESGCRLTFVAANGLGRDIQRAAYEMALFGKDGLVKRLTVFDFKELPDGGTKVRQFDLPDIDCAELGRVLVNDAAACAGPEPAACMERLEATARGAVAFGK